jgi:hypothetical protein
VRRPRGDGTRTADHHPTQRAIPAINCHTTRATHRVAPTTPIVDAMNKGTRGQCWA